MKFRNLIKSAELENENSDNIHVKTVLNSIINKVNNENDNKSSSMRDIVENIKNEVIEHTKKQSNTSIKKKTIEYYLSKRCYSTTKYNLSKAYKEVVKDIKEGKINIEEYANKEIEYTYNLDEDMKMLVAGVLCRIRKDKKYVHDFLESHEVFKGYDVLNKKSRNKLIKDISNGDKDAQEAYKLIMNFAEKREIEILEAELKKYTEKVSDGLRNECISSIRSNVEFMDNYGLINSFVEANNAINKSIYLYGCDYSYDETMELLSEKKLKELSIEQLIGMSAYWENRNAKVINQINKSLYILSHPELYESKTSKDGKIEINVSDETIQNVQTKMSILQKICLEIFSEAELLKDEDDDNQQLEISYEVDDICEKYEKEYKEYFDSKLLLSRNELHKDVVEVLPYENLISNLYTIKSANIQALLISALNSGVDRIQNFGYIKENQRSIKNFMIVGIDIPGMNMPLRLHTKSDSVADVLNSAQNGNNQFPHYKGADDFQFSRANAIIPTQIYVPISKEKERAFKEAEKRINEKDKYAKTIRHISYIACKGKMPEHMMNDTDTIVLEKEEMEK